MPTFPHASAAPPVVQDILYPPSGQRLSRSSRSATPPAIAPRETTTVPVPPMTAKSALTATANSHYSPSPPTALIIPQHRFGQYSRDDLVWMTAGGLLAILVMSCANAVARMAGV